MKEEISTKKFLHLRALLTGNIFEVNEVMFISIELKAIKLSVLNISKINFHLENIMAVRANKCTLQEVYLWR